MIKTAFASSIGRVRETNQDFVKVFKNQNNINSKKLCLISLNIILIKNKRRYFIALVVQFL